MLVVMDFSYWYKVMNMVNEDTSRAMHMFFHPTLVLLRTENTDVLDARPEVDMFVMKYTKQSIKIVIILKRYLIIGHFVISTHPNSAVFEDSWPLIAPLSSITLRHV